jgi:RNA polymerase sigma-70 factor (ECF subfamily)
LEEQFIIRGLRERNKVVFDFVFHYYYSGLCLFAEKITGDFKTAEDIVQDLFVHLWIKNESIQINLSLKNYLFTAVKNRALDHIKKVSGKSGKINHTLQNHLTGENLSLQWFAESELEQAVEQCLKLLPARCREIFVMSRMDGLKNQEIAERLNISNRTVEVQISNALKILRTNLRNYFPGLLFLILFK